MIILRSGDCEARISLEGAELRAWRHRGLEQLWQADPGVWHQTAPWLFPFVGRLRGGAYTHEGRRYFLPIHGFAATRTFSLLSQTDNSVWLSLTDDDHTRAMYPFAFRFSVGYQLDGSGLSIQLMVHNLNPSPMAFGLGGHPGFALSGTVDEWFLQFETSERNEVLRLNPDPPPMGLLSSAPEVWEWPQAGRFPLGEHVFDRDAWIFGAPHSKSVSLVHRDRGPRLQLRILDGPPNAWGIWARPRAPFVCIEPWWGHDDSGEAPEAWMDKPQLQVLGAQEVFSAGLRLELLS